MADSVAKSRKSDDAENFAKVDFLDFLAAATRL
jgi:hypothetical protein